ncbi:MAG: hypothetical protein ACLQA5_07070 [Solirubrobacteraceae bacterium]
MSEASRTRTIRTDYLARVEGEGGMYVKLEGRQVSEVKLRLYEPPRFFEAVLRGRSFTEMPDLTAREIVEQGLQMKKAGNALMTQVGGREVHPINVCVGGFYRAPTRAELRALIDPLERARDTALATVRWTSTLEFPDMQLEPEHVGLADSVGYPIDRGRIVSDRGLDIEPSDNHDPCISCSTHFLELTVDRE